MTGTPSTPGRRTMTPGGGIKTLPAVREEAESYLDYIIDGPDSVVRRWLRAGASGWRLDVADELPDWFIHKIRAAAEETEARRGAAGRGMGGRQQ